MLEGVQVGLDEEEIGARFDGEEAGTGDVDTVGPGEVFDGSSDGGFQLNHFNPGVLDNFVVDNDVQVEGVSVEDAFDGPG